MQRSNSGYNLAILLIVLAALIPFLFAAYRGLVEFHDDTYNQAYMDGFNEGALEGARCGVEWSFESQDKPVPDVDLVPIIQDYSFYTFPMDNYEG